MCLIVQGPLHIAVNGRICCQRSAIGREEVEVMPHKSTMIGIAVALLILVGCGTPHYLEFPLPLPIWRRSGQRCGTGESGIN
jgi:hypothetical protein